MLKCSKAEKYIVYTVLGYFIHIFIDISNKRSQHLFTIILSYVTQSYQYSNFIVGKWADPGGTAMPGQPVTKPEQAPELHPLTKISLISKGAHGPRIRY